MSSTERDNLVAERSFLAERLLRTPEVASLTRASAQELINDLQVRLDGLADTVRRARATLTFSGRPVQGTHGVVADFAAKAVHGFADAVATVAASLTGPLAMMGPIPNRETNQLLIVGTALGSFGFELEENAPRQVGTDGQTVVETALQRTQLVLQASAQGDDDALAEAAAGLDQRALDKVRTFALTLHNEGALCTVKSDRAYFRYMDALQVAHSVDRLSIDNLSETEVLLVGTFLGALPTGRSFEFRRTDTDEVISGKIGPAVLDVAAINANLDLPVEASFLVTRAGAGRARYTLLGQPTWDAARLPAP